MSDTQWLSEIVDTHKVVERLEELTVDGWTIFSVLPLATGYYQVTATITDGGGGQTPQNTVYAISNDVVDKLDDKFGDVDTSGTTIWELDQIRQKETVLYAESVTISNLFGDIDTTGTALWELDQIRQDQLTIGGDTDTSGSVIWELDQLRQNQLDLQGDVGTSGSNLWELDQIRQGGETLINLIGDAGSSGSQLWYSDQILEYLKANLFSKFREGEVLPDQTGVGGVLTFTFSKEMDLIWVRTDDGDACRVDPFGGTPTANQGIQCDTGVVTPINFSTSTIKVYAANGYVKVWGVKY